jgi:hypothetical protein
MATLASEISQIPDIPDIPEELRIASREGRLVLFVGAGASQLAGCPGWSDFADRALKSPGLQKVNHALLDQISNRSLSPRIKLALALDWAQEANAQVKFDKILHPDGWENHADGVRMYRALNSLGRTFVTTNYDRWLDRDFPLEPSMNVDAEESPSKTRLLRREAIYWPEDIKIGLMHRDDVVTVIHLHGSVEDPATMVLTTRDYIRHYGHERGSAGKVNQNPIHLFLEALFHEKCVLFIGYGLDELEILEYVILKAKRQDGGQTQVAKHFILQPFFSHEVDVANGIANYFKNQCGVTLLPFLRDKRNFAQLIYVIEDFAKKIPVAQLLNIERQTFMDSLLDNE